MRLERRCRPVAFRRGLQLRVANNTDLLARVAYEKYEVDGIDEDQDGYSAEVGVRSALTQNFEGYAMAGYEDGDRFDGDFYGRLGAQVKFNQSWGVSGDVKFSDGDTQWFVGPACRSDRGIRRA